MPLNRLAVALPLVLTLAACGGGNPQPPATPTPTAAATPTVAVPATPATPAQPAAAAASNEALAPLIGNWAADLANCGGNLSITVSAQEFRGAENVCSVASWGDNGDGSYTATMNCTSQGQQTTERIQMTPVFAPTGEGINLAYLDRGNQQATILRCPAPRG